MTTNGNKKDIGRKEVEPEGMNVEPPQPSIRPVKEVKVKDNLPRKLWLHVRKWTAKGYQFGKRHKKKAAGILILVVSVVFNVNVEPLTNALGITENQTSFTMDILHMLTGGSTLTTLAIALLILISVGGNLYQMWKGKKVNGILGRIIGNSSDAYKILLEATKSDSKGGKRVVPAELLEVAKSLLEKESEATKSESKTKGK